MARPFHSFVIFAEMRTGSNLLESNLNAFDEIDCLGEVFNPHFLCYPKQDVLFGVSFGERQKDPEYLLKKIKNYNGLTGFRFFHDHDHRVLDSVLGDRHCAKILLTRDPVQSYVSWKIAQSTGQWKLTDVRRRKQTKVQFDTIEFVQRKVRHSAFRRSVAERLQVTGQTAFSLTYEDLQSVEIMNGLAQFLGVTGGLEKLEHELKVQNPDPLSEKVSNYDEMLAALSDETESDLERVSDFEPKRSAAVPTYVTGAKTPLIYLPVKGGPHAQVKAWMAELDSVQMDDLPTRLSQKSLRQWKRSHKGHRSFTVIRHPVVRAHTAFCNHILGSGSEVFSAIRRTLIKRYGLPIPMQGVDDAYDVQTHRAAFAAFLMFLKSNLSGQTAIRVDPAWCTQAQALQGFSGFAFPDHVLRESELTDFLPGLAKRLGQASPPVPLVATADQPFDLLDIYDDEIEAMAASAYQRDYMLFGFDRLR